MKKTLAERQIKKFINFDLLKQHKNYRDAKDKKQWIRDTVKNLTRVYARTQFAYTLSKPSQPSRCLERRVRQELPMHILQTLSGEPKLPM